MVAIPRVMRLAGFVGALCRLQTLYAVVLDVVGGGQLKCAPQRDGHEHRQHGQAIKIDERAVHECCQTQRLQNFIVGVPCRASHPSQSIGF